MKYVVADYDEFPVHIGLCGNKVQHSPSRFKAMIMPPLCNQNDALFLYENYRATTHVVDLYHQNSPSSSYFGYYLGCVLVRRH